MDKPMFKQGDAVTVQDYGEMREGIVESIGPRTRDVFVRMRDTGRVRWYHVESVTARHA